MGGTTIHKLVIERLLQTKKHVALIADAHERMPNNHSIESKVINEIVEKQLKICSCLLPKNLKSFLNFLLFLGFECDAAREKMQLLEQNRYEKSEENF